MLINSVTRKYYSEVMLRWVVIERGRTVTDPIEISIGSLSGGHIWAGGSICRSFSLSVRRVCLLRNMCSYSKPACHPASGSTTHQLIHPHIRRFTRPTNHQGVTASIHPPTMTVQPVQTQTWDKDLIYGKHVCQAQISQFTLEETIVSSEKKKRRFGYWQPEK